MSSLKRLVVEDTSAEAVTRTWHNSCSTDHLVTVNRNGGGYKPKTQRAFIEAIERKKHYNRGINYILPVPIDVHDDDIEARLVALGFTKMGSNRSHIMYHKVLTDA